MLKHFVKQKELLETSGNVTTFNTIAQNKNNRQ